MYLTTLTWYHLDIIWISCSKLRSKDQISVKWCIIDHHVVRTKTLWVLGSNIILINNTSFSLVYKRQHYYRPHTCECKWVHAHMQAASSSPPHPPLSQTLSPPTHILCIVYITPSDKMSVYVVSFFDYTHPHHITRSDIYSLVHAEPWIKLQVAAIRSYLSVWFRVSACLGSRNMHLKRVSLPQAGRDSL